MGDFCFLLYLLDIDTVVVWGLIVICFALAICFVKSIHDGMEYCTVQSNEELY